MRTLIVLVIAWSMTDLAAWAENTVFLVHHTPEGFEFRMGPHIAALSEEEQGHEILRALLDKPPDKTFICDSPFQIVHLHCQVGETVKTHVLDADDFKAMQILIPWKGKIDPEDVTWSFLVDCYGDHHRFRIDPAEVGYLKLQ